VEEHGDCGGHGSTRSHEATKHTEKAA
jgi:hypothetical protein